MSQQQRPHPPTTTPAAAGAPGEDLAALRQENDDLLATALDHIEATISTDSHQELQRARQRSGE